MIIRNSPNQSGICYPRAIMLHHTGGGTFNSNLGWLCNPRSNVSAHYLVGRNGEVARLVKHNHRAWHAGVGFGIKRLDIPANQGNKYCIGIEIVGNGKTPFTEKQLDKLDWLIAHIRQAEGDLPICDHKEYAGKRKSDMGDNFPLANYKRYGQHEKPFVLARPLKLRMRGADVQELQHRLNVAASGNFDLATKKAVIAYQKKHGLEADGIVGKNTAKALGWVMK